MEYFFYCRDVADSRALRKRIVETHWSFMDGYADAMIARGPTLADDWMTQTGSMHIVDLRDAEAARVFAYEEPNYKAGVYREVMVRRWRNALGRKMWEFKGDPAVNKRFLVIGHGKAGASAEGSHLAEAHERYFGGLLPHMIARGPLLSDDGNHWIGSAMMVECPDRACVEAMVASDPLLKAGLYANVEVHNWRFGGRH
jgi:uncharacterized protein YciI